MQLEGLVIPISFNTAMLSKGVDIITDLIGDAVSATFDWAEGMDHLGDVTGMTTDQTAAWSFVAQKAGVSVDTLANSTVIMAKGLFDAEGKLSSTGKALEDFGVSIKDANGNVKDQNTLMNDIAAKYASFGTQTERVDFLTNVFGRSGANLVDVFDVLAQEGGIDAVSQKVKDLGLAIDPGRYEEFTRNLEEIKLAGTGLAINFTESLMPVLERALAWAQQFQGMTPEQIFQRISEMIQGLPERFNEWAKSINWEKVSQDLIKGINSIDWNALGRWVGKSAQKIADGLVAIFEGINWKELFGAIGTAFMEFSTGLVGANFQQFKSVWSSNWRQAQEIVAKAIDGAKQTVLSWLRSLPDTFEAYFSYTLDVLTNYVDLLLLALNPLNAIATIVNTATAPSTSSSSPSSIIGRRAMGGAAGGLTWVGENGPELVNLPAGSYVNNNQRSSGIANQPVQAYIDYDELARTLARVLGQQMQRA